MTADHPQEEPQKEGEMQPAQRVAAAFAGERTDRVPIHHIGFSAHAASVVLGREAYGGGGGLWFHEACALWSGGDAHAEFLARNFEDSLELALLTDQDLVRPVSWRRYVTRPTRRINEYTFLYGDPDAEYRVLRYDPPSELYQVVEQSRKSATTIEDIAEQVRTQEESIDQYEPSEALFAEALQARDRFDGTHAVRCGGVGLHIPYDPVVWLEATVERPDLVARHLDLQVARSCKNAERAAGLGLRYLFGGGDFATNQGPMYSPRVFHELMLPRLIRISQACRDCGVKHLFGTDGNVWPVAADLLGASGVDGYYEIDGRAGMDLRQLRERFPQVTLVGNVASQTLHLGTKEEVVAETRAALAAAKELGGILVGCSNQIVAQTPPENLWAMIETIRKFR